MSGALAAMVGGGMETIITVIVAANPSSGTNFGFNDASETYGSISPTTFRGKTINILTTIGSGDADFLFRISDQTLPQGFFARMTVVDTAGATRTYRSQDAVFGQGGGHSLWKFGNGSSYVWTATGTKTVKLYP